MTDQNSLGNCTWIGCTVESDGDDDDVEESFTSNSAMDLTDLKK